MGAILQVLLSDFISDQISYASVFLSSPLRNWKGKLPAVLFSNQKQQHYFPVPHRYTSQRFSPQVLDQDFIKNWNSNQNQSNSIGSSKAYIFPSLVSSITRCTFLVINNIPEIPDTWIHTSQILRQHRSCFTGFLKTHFIMFEAAKHLRLPV